MAQGDREFFGFLVHMPSWKKGPYVSILGLRMFSLATGTSNMCLQKFCQKKIVGYYIY